ncbi:MAG TPA: FAD binding domain-containing protein [Stellaceae bacterium]|nr:FAD binding domain-containing protein [Stellaceae bacterium]
MKPAPFAYVRPKSLGEAVALLVQSGARALAGGQSLVPMLNLRLAPVERLVDLGGLAELRGVRDSSGSILYGAMTAHAVFEDGEVPDASNGLMPFVAGQFAFRAVRNRGTIGGAIALADPAADWLTTAVALEARLHLIGVAGRRLVGAEEFVLGPYVTALGEGELIEAVEVPKRAASERWGHARVAMKIGDYAESMAIALMDRKAGRGRLVLGAADGAPILFPEIAARALSGAASDELRLAVRRALLAADRGFTPAKLAMHTTTLLRALAQAAAA